MNLLILSNNIKTTYTSKNKLRVVLNEGSFIDIWYSEIDKKKFSYHWERTMIDGSIYWHDTTADIRWKNIKTFPKHFHNGNYENVIESDLSDTPLIAIRQFLSFILTKLNN